MKFEFLFALLAAVPAHAMIGGKAKPFASAVYIQELKCSGVLIVPDVVLTAGHCLFKSTTRQPSLRAGVAVRVHARSGRREEVHSAVAKRVDAHPSWRELIDQYADANRAAEDPRAVDLAFVELDRALPIESARVAGPAEPAPERLVVSGWGCERVGGITLTKLKVALVDARPFGASKSKTETLDHWTDRLAGHCAGDSGGGAYLESAGGTPTVYSINSYLELDHSQGGPRGEVPTISVRLNAPDAHEWVQALLR